MSQPKVVDNSLGPEIKYAGAETKTQKWQHALREKTEPAVS